MTNVNFIESANGVMKSVAGNLRSANKEYTGICSVLKDIQRTQFLRAGYKEVFAAVGVDVEKEKLTPATFFSRVHADLYGTDKKGEKYVGIWGWKVVKRDGEGKAIEREAVLRKVTSWTPRKVFMVLAQSIEAAK